jgi:arginase
MTILFPQWQGSGQSNEIEYGSYKLGGYFTDIIDENIQLVGDEFHIKNDIIYHDTLHKQLQNYKDIIEGSKPKNITTIGGDCSIEIIPVSYLNKIYDNIGIVWLDAHADLNTPESSPSKTFHGMPLRLLLGDGDNRLKSLLYSTINPKQIIYVGLRDADNSEKEYIEKNSIFYSEEAVIEKIRLKIHELDIKQLYIHLDLDVLNPSEFRHVKCPTKGGLTIKELEELLINLKNEYEIVGYSICESTAKDLSSLRPLEKILNLIKKGTMHNN